MRDFPVREKELGSRHDLGDARLVICAEQRRAGCGHDVVPHLPGELRDLVRTQHDVGRIRQQEIAPVIGPVNDRLDTGAAHLGRCIDVRNEPDRRNVRPGGGGRDRRHHVAVVVDARVHGADAAQFRGEIPQQDELCVGAGTGPRRLVGLRVVADVAQESIEDAGHVAVPLLSSCRSRPPW
jgi:hypothetical protein